MKTAFEEMMSGLNEVESFFAGNQKGFKVRVPDKVDVKRIRARLNMTQSRFSDTFGFSLDAIKHWEGGRRAPESSARALLTVIAKNPEAVISALHPHSAKVRRNGERQRAVKRSAKTRRDAAKEKSDHGAHSHPQNS